MFGHSFQDFVREILKDQARQWTREEILQVQGGDECVCVHMHVCLCVFFRGA
jgi:hypothetical protein